MPKLPFSFKVGIILAFLHLAFIGVGAIFVIQYPAAQWQFVWFIPLIIDFPVSLLAVLSFIFCPETSVHFLSYPMSDLRGFIIPVFIFGVIGSSWYFYLPFLISRIFHFLMSKIKKRFRKP